MGYLHTKMMNRLQAALLEHDFIIQYKKGEIMPADYLSRLPSANPDTIAEVTQCFDPFQPALITTSGYMANNKQMFLKQMLNIFKIWQSNCFKMRTTWSGSG